MPRGWNAAVVVSAAVFVLVALLVGIGWLASSSSRTETHTYGGTIKAVSLQLGSGDATIVGSPSGAVEVKRTDRYAFGHRPVEHRTIASGSLALSSACPRILVGSCSSSYEVAVPETAQVEIRTTSGDVRLDGFRGTANVRTGSGDVTAEAYCGFGISAASGSGDLRVAAACAPQYLQLHTGSGDAVALVPPGRYRIRAVGSSRRIAGVTRDASAPFSLDLHSGSGSVSIGGGL
jgi:DUF4097 and DUF4098 domain-containing protein YvlB